MRFQPLAVCPQLQQQCDFMKGLAPSALSEAIIAQIAVLNTDLTAEQAMIELHRAQRLYQICALGLQDHADTVTAYHDLARYPLWDKFVAMQATEAQKETLARLMYEGDPELRSPILFTVSDYGRDVAERILTRFVTEKIAFDVVIEDAIFQRRLFNSIDVAKAAEFGLLTAVRAETIQRRIQLVGSHVSFPYFDEVPPQEIRQAYRTAFVERTQTHSRNLFYTSTRLPTPQAAELDQIPYDEYIDLFFRMCDVDWKQVDAAHRVLIGKLDAGKILRITNDDGTDLTMDLEGYTFANSLVAKNVPGSEVFSAPRRDSVNGIIVAKGRFLPRDTADMVENITMEFENGKIVRYAADSGYNFLQAMIETDEGSHYIGEIGIGTNPVLQRHVVNSLMVEKIGGSFHVALGAAYEYTDYLGTPVALDNGNRSKIHWDITTMLVGKGGMMMLDGDLIMRDGKFTDPALSYLNGV